MSPGRPAARPEVLEAHKHSIRHREEILGSDRCGCFYCGAIFPPVDVARWVDDDNRVGQTAICPQCGIDSVIGSKSGYPITPEFMAEMNSYWFSAH